MSANPSKNRAARRVFSSPEKARRAGVEILHAAPSVWPAVRSRGIWALRGAVRAIWRAVGCLTGVILAAAAVLIVCTLISACLALVPFLLVLIVGGFVIWRRSRK